MSPRMRTWLGQGLLWMGFLGGIFASVRRLEYPEQPWLTVNWWMYGIFAGLALAGVILIRISVRERRSEGASTDERLQQVTHNLQAAASRVAGLLEGLANMTCEDVLQYIDDQCAPHLAEFAEARKVIAHQCGSEAYATVMTEFASGERYLNRAWSAAADGYVDEVRSATEHARSFLSAAVEHLQQALAR